MGRVVAAVGSVVLSVSLASSPASASAPDSPFRGQRLYVDPHSTAANLMRDPASANPRVLRYLARTPTAVWISDFRGVRRKARTLLAHAERRSAYPLFTLYALPHRDCGGYSSGGTTARDYRAGVRALSAGLAGHRAAVVIEPDGLAAASCLSPAARRQRIALVRYAVAHLSKRRGISVYIDIGHHEWLSPAKAARLLKRAGVARARGFSLNVSNFQRTRAETRYGTAVSRRVGDKPFLIDTSRNGRGPLSSRHSESWCNPPGRAVGVRPTANTTSRRVDAYVWVKRPGESDGTCRGGPTSGWWYHARAVEMVRNRAADVRR